MDPTPPAVAPPPARRRRTWPWVVLVVAATVLVGGCFVAVRALGSPSVPEAAILEMKLSGPIQDRPGRAGLAELFGKEPVTQLDHLFNLRKAAADKRIKGVLLRIDGPQLGWAKIEELRGALDEVKKAGKFVVAYAEQYDEKSYALALAADEILTPPESPFLFNGLSSHVLHYPGLLEKLGIEVQYFRFGKYKSVSGETLGRKALTEPVREMINHTLDVEERLFVESVASRRHLAPEEVKALIEQQGLRADWALEHKLIDGFAYEDELKDKLRKRLSLAEDKKVPYVSARNYTHVRASDAGLPEGKGKFALVTSQGLIVSGSNGTDPFSGDDSQGSKPIVQALEKALKDDAIKAVVFRVDSPGGAGLGCDFVRREVELVAKKKPVVVSMSDMAASGGYWVSMDATAIVAEPSTYTGSIGIWTVVPNLKKTYELLGLNEEVFTRGAHADAIDGSRPMTDDEAKHFDDALKASYTTFVELASKGRHKTHEQMEEVAQGRTWLGQDALDKGLVDKLGGLFDAIALAKEKVGIPLTETVQLVPFEGKKSLLQRLINQDDDEGDDSVVDEALAKVWARSEAAQALRPLAGPLAVARELLARHERLFLLPEFAIDVR